ncbi:GLPGLI family protein [Altibacter sp. HG106]|uniref:GLPGLI family protein n=1 Tax=Altibacter sp. HG106 TaxID=3023937 RepID=UPI0023505084|nr:GLPGLI family protein [Altibacter sp. HG106]MDC7994560.1 GLPGLI family protein [Altibacter sp. HG106]
MKQLLPLLAFSIFALPLTAQSITGIATYKSQRKLDIQLDSTQFSDDMRQQMLAMMRKQFEKEYSLTFTETESSYKENQSLDSPNPMASSGGVQVIVAGAGGNDELYKNLREQRFANQVELFGKQFLIQDSLEQANWELHKETKNIGAYTCFKATYRTTRTIRSVSSSTDEKGSDSTNQKDEEEVLVTAWYTPQVPIGHGPANYQGLPGLILEVNDGSQTILCSKIVLNPEDGVAIKEPRKGKKVTDAEYQEIVDKKMEEIHEQQQGRGGKHGNNFEIKIGG